ncbi:flagellar hook-basal body complex protein FliE [Neorhizobium sp. NCHU2750]|uniref:flagellar hook-basal body complex protein FliE n=1 Tax=Neorhizobium sp. NCHU2750 TaxID=1825976 RepID=UPI000E713020|nr:flagellar hook-basal body protein [Neorhizobium sp. NCHU2750]
MIDSISSIGSLTKSNGLDQTESTGTSLTDMLGTAAGTVATGVAGPSFGSYLADAAKGALDTVKNGEAMSFAGIQGKASTREVVDAVMDANRTLQTAIAVRDKVVSAFLDITKMQI